MISFFTWYLCISLLGLMSFPLAYHLFPALADRGYSLSRALGLILWGFIFWLLVSFGVIRNEIGGLLFTLGLILLVSILAAWKKDSDGDGKDELQKIKKWIRSNIRFVITVEFLFFLSFAVWAFIRANNPEMTSAGGEKWMEVAFINAILRSPSFPPHDPWLSGYAISYYYFGYVLTSMMAMLSSTPASIAHNLMLSLVFALSVIGAFGLLYNLLGAYWKKNDNSNILSAIFGPLMLLIVSNAEGFLELLHSYGVGWSGTNNFWTWLNLKDLNTAPIQPYGWAPRFYFWWRASRVVQDFDLRGNFLEIIDEFPFFSYLLGDLHPHVLAMPFGLMAAAMGLNLYLGGWKGVTEIFKIKIPVRRDGLILMSIVLGGLAFLNTWDFPIFLAIISGALVLNLVNERGWSWDLLDDFLRLSIPLALASIFIYLPFYVSFSSQAGGILPNIIFPTRGAYLWVMFGTLLIPLFLFLLWAKSTFTLNWKIGFSIVIGITLLLLGFSSVLGIAAGQTDIGRSFITAQGLTSTGDVMSAALRRRLEFGGGLLTIILIIGLAFSYMTGRSTKTAAAEEPDQSPILFVMMLIVFGGLMVMAPEFLYLRDQFGWRMNTVFKFYYQAWTMWSLSAAFGIAVLFKELKGLKQVLFTAGISIVLLAGLTYPVLALQNKTENFQSSSPERRTLDGAAYLGIYNADDYQAIQWLLQAKSGIIAEAVGGGYSEFARVSTYSGLPTVLGWINHEGQWRGGSIEMGSRADDISQLYSTSNWSDADIILQRYNIHYVYIGPLERSTYPVNEEKFAENLSEIYRQGQVVIYEVP